MLPEDFIKILVAIAVGGAIGLEREFRDKAAGFRTLIFICVGATLFTIFSVKLAASDQDATRIASNIVSGVGFLGAGVILRESGRVIGMTTAAAIWLVAALGMGIGAGDFVLVAAVTGIAVVVLLLFPVLESWVDNFGEERNYTVVCAVGSDCLPQLERTFREQGLRVLRQDRAKHGTRMSSRWKVRGPVKAHDRLVHLCMLDPAIDEFRF